MEGWPSIYGSFARLKNVRVIRRSRTWNLTKLSVLYKLLGAHPRTTNVDGAGDNSCALWPMRWLREIESWTLSMWRSKFWRAIDSWCRTVTMGSRSTCCVIENWPKVFMTDETRLVEIEGLSSLSDEIVGYFRLGVVISSVGLVKRTQWLQSISESLRFRVRSFRSSGWSATIIASREMNVVPSRTVWV